MAPPVSISILIVAWVLCNFMHETTMIIAAGCVAEPKSSLLEQEAKALLESGWWSWWSNYTNGTSLSHCKWDGIKCNEGGHVTKIDITGAYLGDKNRKFNFSSFPNLVFLRLCHTGLRGSIPPEIGTLSKVTHLNLSSNNLTGELPLSLTNLIQLVTLDLSYNSIFGLIHKRMGSLKNLLELR